MDKVSIADVHRGVDPRKKPVPGATPFVPQLYPDAPEYVVVNQPYFNGRLYEIGETVRHPGPLIEGLGSPGRHLKPVGYPEGEQWPPPEFTRKERAKSDKSRKEWVKDLASKF